jgi:flagellar basal body-associated protein FliL
VSEEKKEAAPAADAKDAKKPKGGGGGIVTILIIVLSAMTSSAAGAAFGPVLAGKVIKKEHHKEEEEEEEEKHEPAGGQIHMEPMIVNVRDSNDELHILKVGIAIELKKPLHEEEEGKKMAPPARDAAIEYIRTITYDDATNSAKFEGIRHELGERVAKALGKKLVKRVLFTDFVVQ